MIRVFAELPERLDRRWITNKFPTLSIEDQVALILKVSQGTAAQKSAMRDAMVDPSSLEAMTHVLNEAITSKNLPLLEAVVNLIPEEQFPQVEYMIPQRGEGVGVTEHSPLDSMLYTTMTGRTGSESPARALLLDAAINYGGEGVDSSAYYILYRVLLAKNPNVTYTRKFIDGLFRTDPAKATAYLAKGGQPLADFIGKTLIEHPDLLDQKLKTQLADAFGLDLLDLEARIKGWVPDMKTREEVGNMPKYHVITPTYKWDPEKTPKVLGLLRRVMDSGHVPSPLKKVKVNQIFVDRAVPLVRQETAPEEAAVPQETVPEEAAPEESRRTRRTPRRRGSYDAADAIVSFAEGSETFEQWFAREKPMLEWLYKANPAIQQTTDFNAWSRDVFNMRTQPSFDSWLTKNRAQLEKIHGESGVTEDFDSWAQRVFKRNQSKKRGEVEPSPVPEGFKAVPNRVELSKEVVDEPFSTQSLSQADELGKQLTKNTFIRSDDLIQLLRKNNLLDPDIENDIRARDKWSRDEILSLVAVHDQGLYHSKHYQAAAKRAFPHTIVFTPGTKNGEEAVHSSISGDVEFVVVLSWGDVEHLMPKIPHTTIRELSGHSPHAAQFEPFGWMRVAPIGVYVPERSATKKVWVIEEIQSDIKDPKKKKEAMSESEKETQAFIDTYFDDWHYLIMNAIIKKAKQFDVEEIWVPTAKVIGKSRRLEERGWRGLTGLYDSMAQYYGAEDPPKVEVKYPFDRFCSSYAQFDTDNFYRIKVNEVDPSKIAYRSGEAIVKFGKESLDLSLRKEGTLAASAAVGGAALPLTESSVNRRYAYHVPDDAPISIWIKDAAVFITTFVNYQQETQEDVPGVAMPDIQMYDQAQRLRMAWDSWLAFIPHEKRSDARFLNAVKRGLSQQEHITIPENIPGLPAGGGGVPGVDFPPAQPRTPAPRQNAVPPAEAPAEWGEVEAPTGPPDREVFNVDELLDTLADLEHTRRERALSQDEQELWNDMAIRLDRAMRGGIQPSTPPPPTQPEEG